MALVCDCREIDFEKTKSVLSVLFAVTLTALLAVGTVLCVRIVVADSPQDFEHEVTSCCDVKEALSAVAVQDWGYVDVRTGAHMFWWLFKSTHGDGFLKRPLVLWIQGGPGNSGTGFGNFDLLGPLYKNMTGRKSTWLREASVLFVDSPVGTGYSHVDTDSLLATNLEEVTADLVVFLREFLKTHRDFQAIPLYIVGQSYGGRVAASLGKAVHQAVQCNSMQCDLRGILVGNAWISPVHSMKQWGPMLHQMGLIDRPLYSALEAAVQHFAERHEAGANSSELWKAYEEVSRLLPRYLSRYNIVELRPMTDTEEDPDDLMLLMNTEVREYLGVIPKDGLWTGSPQHSSLKVFHALRENAVTSACDAVTYLLEETDIHFVVYQGTLDLVCPTTGAYGWLQATGWSGLKDYHTAPRVAFPDPETGKPHLFYKSHDDLSFYWVVGSGHNVPQDQGMASLAMLRHVNRMRDLANVSPTALTSDGLHAAQTL